MPLLRIERYEGIRHEALAPALTELLHRAYAPLAAAGMRYWASYQTVNDTLERLAAGEAYLALAGNELVGTICLYGPDPTSDAPYYRRDGVFSIHQFAVSPQHQGRGIGTRLLDLAESRARECGAREMALDTSEQAAGLISLYGARGYQFREYVRWERVNYRSVIMAKPL